MTRYDYVDCRDLRHAWKRENDEVLIETQGQVRLFSRTLVCMRCETRRTDIYQVTPNSPRLMQRVGSNYRYAQGYQVKSGFDTERMRWDLFQKQRHIRAV